MVSVLLWACALKITRYSLSIKLLTWGEFNIFRRGSTKRACAILFPLYSGPVEICLAHMCTHLLHPDQCQDFKRTCANRSISFYISQDNDLGTYVIPIAAVGIFLHPVFAFESKPNEALQGAFGNRGKWYLFQGNRGTKVKFLGEQRQYWGTGIIRKHIFLFLGNRGTS